VRASLCIKSTAIDTTVIHVTREPVGDERAQDKNAAENGYAQQRIPQPLYFSLKLR
jgi:hypothetical protein